MNRYLIKGTVYYSEIFRLKDDAYRRMRHHTFERDISSETMEEAVDTVKGALIKRYFRDSEHFRIENFKVDISEVFELIQLV